MIMTEQEWRACHFLYNNFDNFPIGTCTFLEYFPRWRKENIMHIYKNHFFQFVSLYISFFSSPLLSMSVQLKHV